LLPLFAEQICCNYRLTQKQPLKTVNYLELHRNIRIGNIQEATSTCNTQPNFAIRKSVTSIVQSGQISKGSQQQEPHTAACFLSGASEQRKRNDAVHMHRSGR